MTNHVNTREALAVAIRAFRANGNHVVKETTEKGYANKSYIQSYFLPLKTVHKQLTINLTPDLLEAADDLKIAIDYAVTMEILTKGHAPYFLKTIHEMLKQDTTSIHEASVFIIWAPKLAWDINRNQEVRQISSAYEHTSKHFGKVSDKIEINFTLIEKRFVRSISTWSAYGYNEQGNLIQFLSKHEDLCASRRIRARIKSHDKNRYHNNANVTVVNFVKAA